MTPTKTERVLREREKLNFTKADLAKWVATHKGTRRTVYDSKQPGLALDLRGENTVFYFVRYTDGRTKRLSLGKTSVLTVEQARKQVAALNGQIAEGKDPFAARRAARVEHRFGALWEWWLETHAKPKLRSWKESERLHNKHLKHLDGLRLSAITRQQVAQLHGKLGTNNGKYLANRVLALLKTLFNAAVQIGYEGKNPTTKVQKFEETPRARYLQSDEMPRFMASLRKESQLFQDYFLVVLLTGARRSNVAAMRWDQLHLPTATWTIPATASKNKRTMRVNLPPRVVEILTARQAECGDKTYVFPGRRGVDTYLTTPKFAWKRIIDRAGLQGLRIHDLRHTLASWLVNAGCSLPMVGAALGHQSTQTTARYAHLASTPVAAAVNVAAVALLEAAKPDEEKTQEPPRKVKRRIPRRPQPKGAKSNG